MGKPFQTQKAEWLVAAIDTARRDPARELVWKLIRECAAESPRGWVSAREVYAAIERQGLRSAIHPQSFSGHFLLLADKGKLAKVRQNGKNLTVQSPTQAKPVSVWRVISLILTDSKLRAKHAHESEVRDEHREYLRHNLRRTLNPGRVIA